MKEFGEDLLIAGYTFGIGELKASLFRGLGSGGAVSQGGGEGDVNPHGVVVSRLIRSIQIPCLDWGKVGGSKNSIDCSVGASATGGGKET